MVREVVTRGAHVEAVKTLLETQDVLFRYDQFVSKMPDGDTSRSDFPWHQDEGYTSIRPQMGITIWMALDDVNLENGCVWVMPRSHQGGRLPHESRGGDGFLTLPVEGDGIPAIMKAGEAIAFTGLTLHRSKLNHTQNVRRAFFCTYTHADAQQLLRGKTDWEPVLNDPFSWMVSGAAPIR